MDRKEVLFFYDLSVVKKEADDPLTAIKYFSSADFATDEKCCLCCNLIVMFQAVENLSNIQPATITLSSLVFHFMKVGTIVVGLGRPLSVSKDAKKSLNNLIESIVLRFSSLSSMFQVWEQQATMDDVIKILHQMESFLDFNNCYDIQSKCVLFIENCARQVPAFGAAIGLLYDGKLVHSQMNRQVTNQCVASLSFEDKRLIKVTTEVSTVKFVSVYKTKEAINKLKLVNNLTRKQKSTSNNHQTLEQPRVQTKDSNEQPHSEESNFSNEEQNELEKILLTSVEVGRTLLVVLTEEGGVNIGHIQQWEEQLSQINKRFDSRD